MNKLREYRTRYHLTQTEAVEKFKAIVPEMDVPLLSKMERGVCQPPDMLIYFLNEALASPFNNLNCDVEVILPSPLEDLLKSPIFKTIYDELQTGSKAHPVLKQRLMFKTVCGEREVRRCIEKLRLAGVKIVTLSSVNGYWIAKDSDDADYRLMKYELMARATAMFRLVTAMDGQLSGQIGMDELNG